MRRPTMMVSYLMFVLAFAVVPADSQTLSQATSPTRAEPARTEQMPASSAMTERQKMELRGDVYMARKQYPEAVGVYETMLQEEPRNAVLLNKIGIAYHQMMKLDQAKKYYERSIKADKHYANAVNNLGTVLYNRKKFRQAIKHYRRALELAPEMAATHSNLGYAYFAQKNYEDAMASFQRALTLDPDVFEHRGGFGSVLQDRSVADRAYFYFFLAKSLAQQGNAERCAHYLRRARDEGYKGMAATATDPAFALVINDPLVQEVLQANPAVATAPASKPKPEPQP